MHTIIVARNNICYTEQRNGYITLVSVLVIGAVGVSIAVSLLLFGIGSARTSFVGTQSSQAKALANACAEEALERIREKTSFIGTYFLALGPGTCNFTVTRQGGQNRVITASGTVGAVVRRIKIIIDKINPTIQVVSWQEVANF